MAPEVITGKASSVAKCDVFSVGVMAFILVLAKEPFSRTYSGYWFTLVKLNRWSEFWQDRKASKEFQEFFQAATNFSSEERYSLSEALNCEWVRKGMTVEPVEYYEEMEHRYQKASSRII
jgi:serine/threonine protein kinase